MLFRSLETYLNTNTAIRVLPHLNNYIDFLNIRRSMIQNRFLPYPGHESKFVALLRNILENSDINKLLSKDSDLDCYLDILQYTKKDLNQLFDSTMNGTKYSRMLIAPHSGKTSEYFIPVECEDVFSQLPLDQSWNNWSQVRPIRIVDVDTDELSFNTYLDLLVYKRDYPTRCVVTIDVVALVLQYINFIKTDVSGISQQEYLHQYVLPGLLEDLENLWLCRLYTTLVNTTMDNINFNLSNFIGDNFYGYTGTELPLTIQELMSFIQKIKDGVVKPDVGVNSFRTSEGTIYNYLVDLRQHTSIANLRQYDWMTYLRDIRWMKLLYSTYSLNKNFVGYNNLYRSLRRDLPILYNMKFWTNSHDTSIQDYIKDDIEKLLTEMNVK